jgi:hypothetical protein
VTASITGGGVEGGRAAHAGTWAIARAFAGLMDARGRSWGCFAVAFGGLVSNGCERAVIAPDRVLADAATADGEIAVDSSRDALVADDAEPSSGDAGVAGPPRPRSDLFEVGIMVGPFVEPDEWCVAATGRPCELRAALSGGAGAVFDEVRIVSARWVEPAHGPGFRREEALRIAGRRGDDWWVSPIGVDEVSTYADRHRWDQDAQVERVAFADVIPGGKGPTGNPPKEGWRSSSEAEVPKESSAKKLSERELVVTVRLETSRCVFCVGSGLPSHRVEKFGTSLATIVCTRAACAVHPAPGRLGSFTGGVAPELWTSRLRGSRVRLERIRPMYAGPFTVELTAAP